MREWQPGKAWTHPSIQRLTLAQMKERYADVCTQNEDDRAQYGNIDSDDARELVRRGQERADALALAIEDRETTLTLESPEEWRKAIDGDQFIP